MSTETSNPGLTEPNTVMCGESKRTLVVMIDGTSKPYTKKNTNVLRLFGLLAKDNKGEQRCYYQTGIGTSLNRDLDIPIFTLWSRVTTSLDKAFALFLEHHVKAAYRFIMENYTKGANICIFGFARGGYIAQILTSMLDTIGLLPGGHLESVALAFEMYKAAHAGNRAKAEEFKRIRCFPVSVNFLGVWDAVAGVGVVTDRSLPLTLSNTTIKTFRHALALDERRAKFRPKLYHHLTQDCGSTATAAGLIPPGPEGRTDVLEVWFAGGHGDVGGGAVLNDTPNSLANITLLWMVRQIALSQCGIIFDRKALERAGIPNDIFTVAVNPDPSAPLTSQSIGSSSGDGHVGDLDSTRTSRPNTGTIATNTLDIDSPIHDRLKSNHLWWLLELMPTLCPYQNQKGLWKKKIGFNLGQGRILADENPKIHTSVKIRMSSLGYKPKAQWKGQVQYVD